MRPSEDTYRHKGLRKKLVDSIRSKGISDEAVLEAINKIPRHFFLDSAFDEVAYEDRAFPIAEGQTISQPYTVAYQTQLLEIKKFEKLLEIGTGSAYQAVVLAEMGAQVFTIERQKVLFDSNKNFQILRKYPTIKFFYGDGYEGLPTYAPFDKVIITAAGKKVDFVSRFFAPTAGVDEDPVTGSAHSQLIPFWSEKLGKNKMQARQLSKRGGHLMVEQKGDRVQMGGKCVSYMKGEIRLT